MSIHNEKLAGSTASNDAKFWREQCAQEKAGRVQAEQELHDLQALYLSLVNQMPAGVFRKDRAGRYVFVNSWFCRLKGINPEAMLNKTPQELSSVELCGRYGGRALKEREMQFARQGTNHHEQILQTGKPVEVEEEYPNPAGGTTYLHVVKTPVFDGQGKIIGTQGILFDVTAHKLVEANLQKTQRQLVEASRQAGMAEVATSVLHNVGNVLNSANVSAGLLQQQLRDSRVEKVARASELLPRQPEELVRFLTQDPRGGTLANYLQQLGQALVQNKQSMQQELDSLLHNIERIKGVVAMQQCHAKACGVPEELEPEQLLKEAAQLTLGTAELPEVRVELHCETHAKLRADHHQVLQILLRLLSNACQAMQGVSQARILTLRAFAPDARHVRFEVQDTGSGIAPENLAKMFLQGFTTRDGGHGLGLHTSALIARELGGSLEVHSDGPGHGATFTLELPRQPQAAAA